MKARLAADRREAKYAMPEDEALKRLIARYQRPARQHHESNLLANLQTRARKLGAMLWRNQTGKYRLADGRWISSGLCVGSSDLIGYVRVTMTEADVGRTVAVFTAVEAKAARGRATPQQEAFVARVREAGGIAQIVRSERELEAVLQQATSP